MNYNSYLSDRKPVHQTCQEASHLLFKMCILEIKLTKYDTNSFPQSPSKYLQKENQTIRQHGLMGHHSVNVTK